MILFWQYISITISLLPRSAVPVGIFMSFVRSLYSIYFLGNKFGNRLLYAAIAFNTSLNPITLGYEDGLPIHDNWEEFVQKEVCLVHTKQVW